MIGVICWRYSELGALEGGAGTGRVGSATMGPGLGGGTGNAGVDAGGGVGRGGVEGAGDVVGAMLGVGTMVGDGAIVGDGKGDANKNGVGLGGRSSWSSRTGGDSRRVERVGSPRRQTGWLASGSKLGANWMKRDLIRREMAGEGVCAAAESASMSKRPAIKTGSRGNRSFTLPIRQNPEEAFKHFFD